MLVSTQEVSSEPEIAVLDKTVVHALETTVVEWTKQIRVRRVT